MNVHNYTYHLYLYTLVIIYMYLSGYYLHVSFVLIVRKVGSAPKPTSYHHVVENFLTDWYILYLLPCDCTYTIIHYIFNFFRTSRKPHIIPLRKFVESVIDVDLREFSAENCLEVKQHTVHVHMYST